MRVVLPLLHAVAHRGVAGEGTLHARDLTDVDAEPDDLAATRCRGIDGLTSRRIGEAWHAGSEDGAREVFISPALARQDGAAHTGRLVRLR